MKQPTVRQINAHLWCGTGYCYVRMPDGGCVRVSRVRTRHGRLEGRVICGSSKVWEVIPPDARIELSR